MRVVVKTLHETIEVCTVMRKDFASSAEYHKHLQDVINEYQKAFAGEAKVYTRS